MQLGKASDVQPEQADPKALAARLKALKEEQAQLNARQQAILAEQEELLRRF